MKVTKTHKFEAAHRLMHHPGACRNLHGHSYRLDVEIEDLEEMPPGEERRDGMVLDFGILKSIISDVIDRGDAGCHPFDHSLILNADDPLFGYLLKDNWRAEAGIDNIIVMEGEPTAENMARFIFRKIQKRIDEMDAGRAFRVTKVCLWETPTSYATCEVSDVPS